MRSIHVADVGDGLCMALHTISNETLQVDCGGESSRLAFYGLNNILSRFLHLDYFILSHFHVDHYNGLLYASTYPPKNLPFRVREVYYPRIPKFRERKRFLHCMFAMNARVFGAETGVREYDFLKAIGRLSRIPFRHRPLSKCDLINISGSGFEVLWPPAVIDDKLTLSVIRKALQDFESALEEDEETRRLYDSIREEGLWVYLEGGEGKEIKEYSDRQTFPIRRERKLPPIVRRANKSLADAANHMSLVLCEDNRFLFWGDVEGFEIKQIVDELVSRSRKDFYIFIAPHHGTHWHSSLANLRCVWSVASNGKKLFSRMKPFKSISLRTLATFINGEIIIPIYPLPGLWGVTSSWFRSLS